MYTSSIAQDEINFKDNMTAKAASAFNKSQIKLQKLTKCSYISLPGALEIKLLQVHFSTATK